MWRGGYNSGESVTLMERFRKMRASSVTSQLQEWRGEFGRAYTDRNSLTPEQVDDLWRRNYGVTRTQINQRFLLDIPRDALILEVGCNLGNQLLLLQQLGFQNLHGIEVQSYALEQARARARRLNLIQASALDIPYKDGSFDLVFTSGVLIHIAPHDLPLAMTEIHRCTRSFIMGAEYFAPTVTEVNYRSKLGLLWKMDYAQEYLSRFEDLQLVKEERMPYLGNTNVDTVFLLRKIT
jgi:pseudaminic acid biosynthesis-associated methylase